MAKRRQKSSSKKKAEATEETLVVGFLGTGKISKKAATALLGDWVEARDETVQFAVPINEDHWTQSMATVATFAEENDIEIIAVHDGEEDNDPEDLLEGKFSAVKSKNVPERVIKESDLIVFLWEDTEEMEELLDIANEKDLDCYDLGDGLQRLELEEVEDESGDEDEDEPETDDEETEEDEDEEFPEVDLATFDIDSLDTKDDRDRIMAIGEDLGVESYKGMRVGTMIKEIKKAQKVLQAQQAADGDDGDEPEEKPAKATKKASKKAEAKDPEPETGEVYDAEVLSSSAYPANVVVNVNISLNGEDLTDETLNVLREFLAGV